MLDLEGGSSPQTQGLALARKWRPHKFADMVGQKHVVDALQGALKKNRLHHAFMFSGTRGVGKTTLARILAKGFICEHLTEGEPCEKCDHCLQVDDARHPDVIELDAASNTQVDSMRSLLESAQYVPSSAKYKIYIIDEVHMLSKHSFNAMLKTLEEPPEHVKFILATTDPQLVPPTVRSRCLWFVLKRLPVDLIAKRLRYILKEGKDIEEVPEESLEVIAEYADGSLRDALSILDEALAVNTELKEEEVRTMVGAAKKDSAENLLKALVAGDAKQLLDITASMHEQVVAFDRVCSELAKLFHKAQLVKAVPELGKNESESEAVKDAAKQLSMLALQTAFEVLTNGVKQINSSIDAKTGFDMLLLRVLALNKEEFFEDSMPSTQTTSEDKQSSATKPEPAPTQKKTTPNPSNKQVEKTELPLPLPINQKTWENICAHIIGPAKSLAEECVFVSCIDEKLMLSIALQHEHLLLNKEKLQKTVVEICNFDSLEIVIKSQKKVDVKTPKQVQQEQETKKKAEEVSKLEQSDAFKQITDKFPNASVVTEEPKITD